MVIYYNLYKVFDLVFQVALLLYDNTPSPQWMLHDFSSKASLLRAFNYMPYHNGTSRTDLALQYVRENMLQVGIWFVRTRK